MAATTTPTEPPSRPEPGEGELTLGNHRGGLVDALSEDAVKRITASLSKGGAGSNAPVNTAPDEDAAPPPPSGAKATPPVAPTPPAPKPEAAPPKAAPAPTAAAAKPADPATPPKPEEIAKASPKQLREAWERAQAKLAELEASGTATHKQLAEAHSQLAASTEKLSTWEKRYKEEFEPLQQLHAETAKKLQEREEALRIRDYTATPEWHDKYVKPIADVQAEAQAVLAELAVVDAEGHARAATMEDFNRIHSAPSLNAAEAMAKQLFGEGFATTELVRASSRLRALSRTQQEALKRTQLESAEYFKRKQLEEAQQRERFVSLAQERERAYAAQRLQVPDTDTELREALNEGKTLADLLANGAPDMTPEKWADTVARSRVEVMSAGVLRKQLARVQAEKAALEKELAGYRVSEPAVETRADTTPREPATPSDNILENEADLKARLTERLQKSVGRR